MAGKRRGNSRFVQNSNGEVTVDFQGKKVKDDFNDINRAQEKTLETLTDMVQTMRVYEEVAPEAVKKLQAELDRLNTEKGTRAIKKQQKEIEKILTDLANASAKAQNVLSDKNVDPSQTTQAYRELAMATIDANAATEMIAISNERQAVAAKEAALAEREKSLDTLKSMAATTKSLKEQEALNAEIKKLEQERLKINNQLAGLTEQEGNVRETTAGNKADVNKKVDDVNQNLPTADKNKLEAITSKIKESANQLISVLNAINIADIANSLEIQESDRKKIRRESEMNFGLNHAEFEDYKKETITQMTNGLDGLFNGSDLKQYLQDANKFGFESAEQAAKMSQDIMVGNKLLGISTDTQVASFQLQKRLGDNTLIKKQNDRIATLLSEQLGVSKDQLEEMEKQSMETAEAYLAAGGDASKIDSVMDQLDAMKMAAKETGTADPTRMLEEFMKSDFDTQVAMAGNNVNAALSAVNEGDMMKLKEILTGSSGVNSMLKEGGTEAGVNYSVATDVANANGWGTGLAYSRQMAQTGKEDEVNNATLKYLQDLNNKEGAADETAQREAEKNGLIEKWTNDMSISMEDMDWGFVIGIEETTQLIEKSVKAIEVMMGAFAIKDLIGSVKDIWKFFKGGKGSGLVSKLGGVLGKSGVGTTATSVIGGASLLAGLAWTGYDAYKGAKEGITDDKGNQVMKAGFGSALTSAVSGSKVATEESAGSSAKASAKNIGGGALNGAGKGALIGAGIGSFIPGVGTAVGAGVGALVGAIGGAIGGIFKDQERKKMEAEKKSQEELKKISENTFNTEKAIGSLGTQVSVRWRPDQVSYGGGLNNNYIAHNHYGFGGGQQFGIGGSHPADPGHKPPITAGWPTYPSGGSHKGVDFGVVKGTPIGSSVAGTIEKVGTGITRDGWLGNSDNGGWGNYVMIRGDDGNRYTYAHLSQVNVTKGHVDAGMQIGLSGNTGNTSGPHLHYQVDDASGNNIDPFPYITSGIFDLDPNATVSSGDNSGFSESEMKSLASAMSSSTKSKSKELVQEEVKRNFTYNRNDMSVGGGIDNAPVVSGLKDIKQTLIDLANRQNYQQKLIEALSTKPIKLSV